MALLSDEVKA